MAELNCVELHLPSEFLAEEGVFVEKKGGGSNGRGTGDGGGDGESCFPSEFPYEWVEASEDISPVGSVAVMGSGGEDCVAALTRQMAHYFVPDDDKAAFRNLPTDDPKASLTVGSPQCTLHWNASSGENSDVRSLVSSPPSTPLGQQKDASTGQVHVGTKLNEEGDKQQKLAGRGLLCPPAKKPFAPFPAIFGKNATTGYYAPALSHQQRMIQQLKRHQLTELQAAAAWRQPNRVKEGGGGLAGGRPTRPPGSPTIPWVPPRPPQQAGSGMRALFLGPAWRRGSCGTGVFLPRRVGRPTEPRKKPAMSTVLLPARVMQALKLNLDEFGASPRLPGGFLLDHDAIVARSNAMRSRRSQLSQPVPAAHHGHEVCLPSEWTY